MEGVEASEIGGRYRIIGPLGEGGMAKVHLAYTTSAASVAKLVVIKLLRPELASDPAFVEMFLDEARLAALLSHPNVIHTYEVGSEDGQPFLVMEYLEGQALSSVYKRLPREKMSRDLQLHVLAELLSGLDYAHDLTDHSGKPLHVVHRDVSPQNVMITYDAHVKVLDFGIAKAMSNNTSTLTGTLKGKVAYISPEQALGAPVSRSADVFAVGVMLWEALAGRRINVGLSDVTLLTRRASREEPRIRDVVPDVDPRLSAICDRAMAYDPADRYPSCGAFRDALDELLPASGRRARTRELAELMRSLFAEERDRQRALVEAALQGVHLSTSGVFAARTERTPNREPTPSVLAKSVEPAPLAAVPTRARRSPTVFAVAGVLAVAALGIGVALRPHPGTSGSTTTPPVVEPASSVPSQAPSPSPSASIVEAPAPAATSATPEPPKPRPVVVATKPKPVEPIAVAPTPTPTASAPTGKKPKHTIDEKDPYAP